MKIAFGCDHSVFTKRDEIIKVIENLGHEVIDCGTKSDASVNYPFFGYEVGRKVARKEADFGIAICGTGIGIGISANKVKTIRCVVANKPQIAILGRKKYDANVLAIGIRVVDENEIPIIIQNFLNTQYSQKNICFIKKIKNFGQDNFDVELQK